MAIAYKERPPSSPYRAYLEESARPFTCLIFTLPLFMLYHLGVWFIREFQQSAWQNGADILLRRVLSALGVSGPLLSLFLVAITLLFLQQASGKSWKIHVGTLALMALECIVFALPPFLLGKLVQHALLNAAAGPGAALTVQEKMILSLGAGVYEEFLFRMLLMGLLFLLFRRVFKMEGVRVYMAVMLIQAVLFSLFHHLPGGKEALSWELLRSGPFLQIFAFRTLAGVYFGYLYQERGFGIAAGSHALYDVVAVALDALR